eukprot:3415081-Rhodomonas_salina.1
MAGTDAARGGSVLAASHLHPADRGRKSAGQSEHDQSQLVPAARAEAVMSACRRAAERAAWTGRARERLRVEGK